MPSNVLQKVLDHEQASTTLTRYTHTQADLVQQVREAYRGVPLTLDAENYPRSHDGLGPDGV